MNQKNCFNCFQPRDGEAGPCPHCGYDPAADQGKYPFALPHGSILAGQFITGRVLGQGGFGITYLARDNKLDVKVAIKEFLPDSMAVRASGDHQVTVYTGQREENFRYGMDRFLDEARVLAKFQGNPNIVGVRSYFEENGTAYFVMDYIEGESFKAYIQNKGGKVSWQEAVRILTPVMNALGAVHKEGIIHRDVTPDNIVLTADGGVKLLDFGSARYSLGDKSKSLDVVLKAGYAPKEQYIRRGKQGPYTDVYSLAACFYASITGYLPPEALERMDEDDLVPPSTRGIKVPSGFEDVILKGLEVQPGDRYQSMEEFRAAMDAALRGEDTSNQTAGPVPGSVSGESVKAEAGGDSARVNDFTSGPVRGNGGGEKASLGDRIKALPMAVKGGVAAAACLVIVLGAMAVSGMFSGDRPSAIDSGGGGTAQAAGDLHHTAQEGGIGQVDAPNGSTPEEETVPEDNAPEDRTEPAEDPKVEAPEEPKPEEPEEPKKTAEPAVTPTVNTQSTETKTTEPKKDTETPKPAEPKKAEEPQKPAEPAKPTRAELQAAADRYRENKQAEEEAECYRQMRSLGYITAAELSDELIQASFDSSDWKVKFKLYKEAADLGNSSGMYGVGLCYKDGHGVEKNDSKAFEWLLKAAKAGSEGGCIEVGYFYNEGRGTKRDVEQAVYWIQKGVDIQTPEKTAAQVLELLDRLKAELDASKAPQVTTVTNQRYTYSDPYMSGASGSYTGDWKDGKPNGQGTLIFDSEYSSMGYPSKYVGSWVNGNKHGYGVATWSNGDKYEGNFSNNKKSGWGKMTYSDGTVWEGNWSNDAPDK